LDIEDTERDIARLKQDLVGSVQKDMSQDQKILLLVNENAQLKLYFAALVRLLTKNNTITKSDLEAIVAVIDAEDGRADGQFSGPVL
jgi:hypothetical protein